MIVPSWSLSRLKDYERCPALYAYRVRKQHVEAPSPALERGNRIHALMEAAMGGATLEGALARYQGYVDEHRAMPGLQVERMWSYDVGWRPDGAPWLRMKLDAFVQPTWETAKVIDWKTGRIYGDYDDGMRLYALGALLRFPTVKEVEVELVYLDQRKAYSDKIKREKVDTLKDDFNRRALRLFEDEAYDPSPGDHCRWCGFSAAKGGPCKEG